MSAADAFCLQFLESRLGWIGVATGAAGVRRVTFGHASEDAARSYLTSQLAADVVWQEAAGRGKPEPLLSRLADFAAGAFDDFLDVELDFGGLTPFQRRVLTQCRRIAYGETMSYGRLAARVGNPGAARAVGSTMAANRWPLLVPCHRVVQAGGKLGNYSAPQGVAMKRRLLELEAATVLV